MTPGRDPHTHSRRERKQREREAGRWDDDDDRPTHPGRPTRRQPERKPAKREREPATGSTGLARRRFCPVDSEDGWRTGGLSSPARKGKSRVGDWAARVSGSRPGLNRE